MKPLVLAALLGTLLGTVAHAAEIRLRSDAHATGSIVHLGDVAEVFAADDQEVQSLSAIELTPAPISGKQRQMSVREIQDTLERRGLNLLQFHFSGAGQVTIAAANEQVKQVAKTAKTLPLTSVQEAQRAVADAIVQYLQRVTASGDPWNVSVDLTAAQAQLVLADVHHLTLRGGQAPWPGKQSFEVEVRSDKGPTTFSVAATVTLPAMVVVTTKDVPCGAIIQADDVALQRLNPGAEAADGAFATLDEVVGREAILAIAPGQVLDPQYVRTPVLVKRGSIVTVYVMAPGIKIRTTGRAREDGSRGQLITVEAVLDRKTFFSRVTGIDQVVVNAEEATTPEAVAATEPGPGYSARSSAAKARMAAAHPVRTAAAMNSNDNLGNR
ncbi:MAG TPA: flagellar basal body P-ring formation chaperone FlgA [Pirellulales bacterium]|nr:flagellar basal body P-ring formation chaperone FlgA [Pirellulales bacterium]